MKTQPVNQKTASILFRFVRVVLVLVFATGISIGLIALKEKPQKQIIEKTPPLVQVITVLPERIDMTVEAFGTVIPRKQVTIAAEVPGKIDQLHPKFVAGGQIRKNDLLVQIDQRSFLLDRTAASVRLEQAKTDIKSLEQEIKNLGQEIQLSRANVRLVQKEFERIRTLAQNQFASKTTVDRAEQQYLQAKIALQTLENRLVMTGTMMEQRTAAAAMAGVDLQRAELAWEKTRILSPFDGWVLARSLEAGDFVSPGQNIGVIYEKGALDVDVGIPQEQMRWIDPVLSAGQLPEAKITVAHPDGNGHRSWPAKVVRFKAGIDEKTRTLPITLEILTSGMDRSLLFDLKPGAFVQCSISGVQYDDIFVLPRHLVRIGDIVFTINADHRLEMKKVDVLRRVDEHIFIRGGLNPGDKVIISPLPNAIDGMVLTLTANGK